MFFFKFQTNKKTGVNKRVDKQTNCHCGLDPQSLELCVTAEIAGQARNDESASNVHTKKRRRGTRPHRRFFILSVSVLVHPDAAVYIDGLAGDIGP